MVGINIGVAVQDLYLVCVVVDWGAVIELNYYVSDVCSLSGMGITGYTITRVSVLDITHNVL